MPNGNYGFKKIGVITVWNLNTPLLTPKTYLKLTDTFHQGESQENLFSVLNEKEEKQREFDIVKYILQ